MTKTIFITGTDTEIGKTYVSLSLINTFNKEGLSTFGIKLIASGCKINANGSLKKYLRYPSRIMLLILLDLKSPLPQI